MWWRFREAKASLSDLLLSSVFYLIPHFMISMHHRSEELGMAGLELGLERCISLSVISKHFACFHSRLRMC